MTTFLKFPQSNGGPTVMFDALHVASMHYETGIVRLDNGQEFAIGTSGILWLFGFIRNYQLTGGTEINATSQLETPPASQPK